MSHQAPKAPARPLGIDDVAKTCRWTESTARRYMGEMLRLVPPPGEPETVTRAALERWLVRNCDRAVGPAMTITVDLP
ncbi:MAG TPA: hypothetical protein VFS43_38200 [Polyangiaceae bacterium]|nr:hypothetical protein [Polyangiaceae bacterium]